MVPWQRLDIGDGTFSGTLRLADDVDYTLVSWGLQTARRRRSEFGGRGPFYEVEETITVHVLGNTPALAYENLERLYTTIDRVAAWRESGGLTAPITIKALPAGSKRTKPLTSLVLGWASDDRADALPAEWNPTLNCFLISNVMIRIVRSNPWLDDEEAPVIGSSQPIGTIHLVSWTNAVSVDSPITARFGGYTQGTLPVNGALKAMHGGYVVLTPNYDDLLVIEGEALTRVSGYTVATVTDSANLARGGSVLRLTADATGKETILEGTIGSTFGNVAKKVYVFVVLRQNNAADVWSMTAQVSREYIGFTTRSRVATQQTQAQILAFPLGLLPNGATKLRLTINHQTLTSNTFDIDYVVLVNVQPQTRVIGLSPTQFGNVFASNTTALSLLIDHRALTHPDATVRLDAPATGEFAPLPYQSPIGLSTVGKTAAAIVIATGTLGQWRAANAAGSVVTHDLAVARRAAYLTPR